MQELVQHSHSRDHVAHKDLHQKHMHHSLEQQAVVLQEGVEGMPVEDNLWPLAEEALGLAAVDIGLAVAHMDLAAVDMDQAAVDIGWALSLGVGEIDCFLDSRFAWRSLVEKHMDR